MPRKVEKRLVGQKPVRAQESFDFSVPRGNIVYARPTDPYVEPATDNSMNSVMGFLDSVGKAGGRFLKERDEGKRQQGAIDKAAGVDAPKSKSTAYLEGWEAYSGEAAVADYKVAMQDLLSKSADMDIEEFTNSRNQITDGFLRGRTNAYVQSFILKARDYEDEIDQKYAGVIRQQHQQKVTDEGIKRFNLTMGEMIGAEQTGPSEVHAQVVQLRDELEALGFYTKKEAAQLAMSTVGSLAVEKGMPELMNFSVVKDSDGVAMADTSLKEDIYRYTVAAENEYHRQTVRRDQAKKAEHDERIDEFQKVLVEGLTTGNCKEAQAQLIQLGKSGNLTLTEYKAFTDAITEMEDEANWGKTDDLDVYHRLEKKAYRGELSLDEVRFNQSNLSHKSGTHLLTLQNSIKERSRSDRANKNPYHPEDRIRSRTVKKLTAKLYGQIPVVDGGDQKAEEFEYNYGTALNEFWNKHKRRPEYDEAQEMADKAMERVEADWEWDPINRALVPRGASAAPSKPTQTPEKRESKLRSKAEKSKAAKTKYTAEGFKPNK